MARYIKRVMLSHDYPDLALVGQTIVHINNVPEDFINEGVQRDSLQQELKNLAEKAGETFHAELAAEAHIKEGSIIVDIFFNCELPTLLSVENLKALGVYFEEPIMSGVQKGTELYSIYLTFRAIKRLERAMTKICGSLKYYILIRFSAAKNIIKQNKKELRLSEGRKGVLGLLVRLFDAVDVCNSTSGMDKKLDAMKRVKNAISILDDSILRNEDREFLCKILLPLIENIKEEKISKGDHDKNITGFNSYRDASIKLVKKLRQITK